MVAALLHIAQDRIRVRQQVFYAIAVLVYHNRHRNADIQFPAIQLERHLDLGMEIAHNGNKFRIDIAPLDIPEYQGKHIRANTGDRIPRTGRRRNAIGYNSQNLVTHIYGIGVINRGKTVYIQKGDRKNIVRAFRGLFHFLRKFVQELLAVADTRQRITCRKEIIFTNEVARILDSRKRTDYTNQEPGLVALRTPRNDNRLAIGHFIQKAHPNREIAFFVQTFLQ